MPEEPEIEAMLSGMTEEERESFWEHEQRVRAWEYQQQRTYGRNLTDLHQIPEKSR